MRSTRLTVQSLVVVYAVTIGAITTVSAVAEPVALTINYEDKQVYMPDSDILVKFTLRNVSGEPYRFRLAQNRMFNVDFTVRTLANQALPPARHFITQRTSNQQLFYRDVSLEPDEEFSFVENLADYVLIEDAGVYVVQAVFYPELISAPALLSARNALSLSVRPPLDEAGLLAARVDDRTLEVLERHALPPDEVVSYAVRALQDRAWNRFFLYVDLEGLLLSDAARARSYRSLGEAARRQQLVEFRSRLEQMLVEPELSVIPTDFRMVRTTYDPDEATVIMDLTFAYPRFSEIKRYTYFLRRADRIWYIHDYAVTNLGAVQR